VSWSRWRGTGGHRRRGGAVVPCVLLGSLLVACAEPAIPDPVPAGDGEEPIEAEVLDPVADELAVAVEELRATVEAARAELRAAAGADDVATASAAAGRARALLLDDDAQLEDLRPLFPAVTTQRGTPESQDDALSATLTLARDAGGDTGRATVEVLRDPVAGDLGAWERDAEGVVARARAATSTSGSLADQVEELGAEVQLLEGDGVRALAWTLAAAEAASLEDVQVAAERAGAHLGVVAIALDLLTTAAQTDTDDGGTGDPDAEGDA
jgi:hypothetical protein